MSAPTPDEIARDLWLHREELRRVAAISSAIDVARAMLEEIEIRKKQGAPLDWCNPLSVDAVLSCASSTAMDAYRVIMRLVGDLDKAPRESPSLTMMRQKADDGAQP
ncbi:MAG: hypothetical protein ACOYB3_12900 [Azonexus sp.]